jgi:hypothetical protein
MISEVNISRVFTSFRSALISRPMPGARWYLAIRSMASDIRPTKPSDGLRAASPHTSALRTAFPISLMHFRNFQVSHFHGIMEQIEMQR